jgi:tetratricopeptide (TPR) repeat protein
MDDLKARGIEHFNAGRFNEALACFRAALAAGDRGPETRCFLGHVAGSLGRRPEAIEAFGAVIREHPRHLPAYSGLANVILHQSPARDPKAEKLLRGILALKPGGEGFRERLIDALRACGQAFRAAGDLETAEKALSKALVLGDRDRPSRRRLIDILRMRSQTYLSEGDLVQAEKELRKVLELEPGDAASRRGLVRLARRRGLAHVSAGRLGEAKKALLEVLLMREQTEQIRLRAARLAKAEKVRRLSGRGGALVTAGRLKLAEAALRRALLVAPDESGVGRQLAEVLLMREQAEQARALAARLKKAERVRVLLEELKAAGQAYKASGWTKKAERLLTRILKIDPDEPRPYLFAGGILFSSGRIERGRALLKEALRLDRGRLLPGERFTAQMKLGRYAAALAGAEKILDGRPALGDVRAFWDPWEWDDRPLEDRRGELLKLERAAGRGAARAWVHYYRADLHGPEERAHFRKLAAFPRKRYAWMFAKAGLAALCDGRFPEAETWLRGALAHKTVDWRTRGFLAEALLCLRRPDESFAQMDLAAAEAPVDEAGQVVAWRGALDLWLGRYDSALAHFDEALRLGAPYALAWRAGALLKLGRSREALEQLDLALERFPRDLEAYVWRGEAKRALGLDREALADLDEPALAGAGRATPIWLWALVNRALAKGTLGDRAGMKSDFEALPAHVVGYIREKTGLTEMEDILRAGLDLSRGFRREEYRQAIWMI